MAAKKNQGIRARHGRSCKELKGGACSCKPSYEAWVWSPSDNKKIRRTFPTLAAAKGWRRDALSSVAKGKMRAPTPITVGDDARAWLDRLDKGLARTRSGTQFKPSTARNYRRDVEQHIIPKLGGIRLARLRRRDVQTLLVDELVAAGYSGSKVMDALNALRAVLRRAIRDDELMANPLADLDLPALGGPRQRAATPEEAAALLSYLPDHWQALWATAFYAGLRRGELRALRWSDIDDAITEIHVQRGWDDKVGAIEPKSQKGARRVPVPTVLRLLLLEHKARTGRRGTDFVFGSTATTPFTASNVTKQARRAWAAVAVGAFLRGVPLEIPIEPIGLHECRHTYVSIMHAAGRSLEEIGDYVGHTSAYMTDRYRHLLDGQRAEAAAAFDAFVSRSTGAPTGAQLRESH